MTSDLNLIEDKISKEEAQAVLQGYEDKLPMAKKGIKYSLLQFLGASVASLPFIMLAFYFRDNLNSTVGSFVASLLGFLVFIVSAVWVIKRTIGFSGLHDTAIESAQRAKDRCRFYIIDYFFYFCDFCNTYLWCFVFPIIVTIKCFFYLKRNIRLLRDYCIYLDGAAVNS